MNNFNKLYLLLIFVFCAAIAHAQVPPPAVPIDGGLSLLLGAGAIYGVKKIADSRKTK